MARLRLRRLWICVNHCGYPVLYRVVGDFLRSFSEQKPHITLRIRRKPLGEPNPSVANLALAIVLVVVASLQTIFVRKE